MKLRLMPILIMLVSIAGVVLFATTPIIVSEARYVNEGNNTDYTQTFNVFFGGNGESVIFGDFIGSPQDDIDPIDKNNWNSYLIAVEPYPDIAVYFAFIGLGIAFLGIFFSIFGYSNGLRIAGALLGIIGGGLGLTGCFLLYSWTVDFQESTPTIFSINAGFSGSDYTITYGTFGLGWLAPVISSGLVILGSIAFLIIKPKK